MENANKTWNNFSNKDYGTDVRLWACANDMMSSQGGSRGNLQVKRSERAEALAFDF